MVTLFSYVSFTKDNTYLRIGLLHEKSGNTVEADIYFNKALSLYQGESTNIAHLKDAVERLDKSSS